MKSSRERRPTMKIEKAVGYLRVSTKDQERHSPHKQYQDIMRYLEEKSYQWRKERLKKIEIELDERVTGYSVRSDDSTTPEFEALGIFTEAGSGWKPDSRDEWPKMLQYIGEHGIKHLIVGWTDRLYRNMEEYGSLLHMLRTCSADVNIHIINEGVVFNPSHEDDSFEFMQHSFQVIQGFVESQKKSKRVKSARKEILNHRFD
jgi:DNA invertase Pin-like site-specific DNA recombinase